MTKISVIGSAGNIGRSIVYHLVQQELCDEIVMLDLNSELAKGYRLDILQAMAVLGKKTNIIPTSDYKDIQGSDVVIVPAGFPRKDGMTREDLLIKNVDVIKVVAEGIKKYAPNAFVIVITNPLDLMVYAMYKLLGFKKSHVVGMAGMLDGARLKYQVSQALNVGTNIINPMVIGAHNDNMVILPRYTTVGGKSLAEFVDSGELSQEKLKDIIEKVKKGGAEIVSFLKTGSAFYGPAVASVFMADCYLNNNAKYLSCSTLLEGEYGVNGYFVGVPVGINSNGATDVLELDLNAEEKKEFDKSIVSIKDGIGELNRLMDW